MAPPGGYTGRLATVLIEDALIGPGKAGGTSWDPGTFGNTTVIPTNVLTELGVALGLANPFAAAAAVLAGPALSEAISAVQKPDVYGTIRLDGFGAIGTEYWLAPRERRTEDSFTPTFPTPSGYQHVPIDADVRIRVHLGDADALDSDDEVGIAVINGADLRDALASQMKFHVQVADQTSNQILFIGVTVLEE